MFFALFSAIRADIVLTTLLHPRLYSCSGRTHSQFEGVLCTVCLAFVICQAALRPETEHVEPPMTAVPDLHTSAAQPSDPTRRRRKRYHPATSRSANRTVAHPSGRKTKRAASERVHRTNAYTLPPSESGQDPSAQNPYISVGSEGDSVLTGACDMHPAWQERSCAFQRHTASKRGNLVCGSGQCVPG